MSEITHQIHVVNEDGTELGFEFPKHPLKEKWDKLYPPTPMSQYSQVCDGYSCMWCDRCPKEVIGKFLTMIKKYGMNIKDR